MFNRLLLLLSLFTLSILTSFSFASYSFNWLDHFVKDSWLSWLQQLQQTNHMSFWAVWWTVVPLWSGINSMPYAATSLNYFTSVPSQFRSWRNIWSTAPRVSKSINFASPGTFSNGLWYPYRKTDWTFWFYDISVPNSSFLSLFWRWAARSFNYFVPQNWWFAMYDYTIDDFWKWNIYINQFSNWKIYEWYYMQIEGQTVYLFDFKREVVFIYNAVGDSKYLLQDKMWWAFLDDLIESSPSSVYKFTYDFSQNPWAQNNLFPYPLSWWSVNYKPWWWSSYAPFWFIQIAFSWVLSTQSPDFYVENQIPIDWTYETPTQKENYTQCLDFADWVKELATRLSACRVITDYDLPMVWTGDNEFSWIYNTLDITDPYDFSWVADSFISTACIDTYDHITTYYDYYIWDYLTWSSGNQIWNLAFEQKFYDYYMLARKNHTNPAWFDPLTYCQNTLRDPSANVPDPVVTDWVSSLIDYLSNINNTISSTLNWSTWSIINDTLWENSLITSFLDKISSPFNAQEDYFDRSNLTCETTDTWPFWFIIIIPFLLLNLFIFRLFHNK